MPQPTMETLLVETMAARGLTLTTAESLTGGMVAERVTRVPGASNVLGFGFVTYSAAAKSKLVGVPTPVIDAYTVVSAPVAASMATGALAAAGADIALALTGLAGPGGGTAEIPVGTVFVAAARGEDVWVRHLHLTGTTREENRQSAADAALEMGLALARGEQPAGAVHGQADTPPENWCVP